MNGKPLHPAWLRILHWVHFYAFGVMVWSGLAIYWAFQAYKIKVGNTMVYFVPKVVFEWLGIKFSLATGLAYHFSFMWLILGTGLMYFIISIASGNWRHLFPTPKDIKGVFQMMAFSLGLRKNPPRQGKYNPTQKIAYFSTVMALILLVFSGVAIYKPARMGWLTGLFGGYKMARAFHFWCTYYLVFFFVVHVIQVIRSGWRTFAAMITGGKKEAHSPSEV